MPERQWISLKILRVSSLFLGLVILSVAESVFAVGAGITYHGRLIDPNGNPVVGSSVQFKIQLRTPGNENCLMYEEVQIKDLSQSQGIFSITINDGSGSRLDTTGLSLDQVFANRGSFSFAEGSCSVGTVYNTSPSDGRKIQVSFNDGSLSAGTWEPAPSMPVNFVPMSLEAMQVGGYKKEKLLRIASGVDDTQTELNSAAWTELLALVNGTSSQFVKSGAATFTAAPQWSGTPSAANDLVNKNYVDSQVAAGLPNIGTAGTYYKVTTDIKGRVTSGVASLVEADIPTLSTAGKVSGGAINSGTIAGTTSINSSGNLVTSGTVQGSVVSATNFQIFNGGNYVQLSAPQVANNLNFILPLTDGANGTLMKTNGSGQLSFAALSSSDIPNLDTSKLGSGILSVARGGTGAANYGNNSVILSNPTGTAFSSLNCTLGQVIKFDISGNAGCANDATGSGSQWTTSGSDIYYSAGNVGIGTSSPTAKLDIVGANATGTLPHVLRVIGGSTTNGLGGDIGSPILIQSGNGMLNDSGGEIKIETGTGTPGGILNLIGHGGVSITSGRNVNGNTSTEFVGYPINITAASGAGQSIGGDVVINPGAGAGLGSNGKVIIANLRGNVGVGTTSPTSPLHAYGVNAGTGIFQVESSTSGVVFKAGSSTGAMVQMVGGGGIVSVAGGPGTGRLNVGSLTSNSVSLAINGIFGQTADLFRVDTTTGTTGSAFKVTSSGNVGIGNVSPTEKLSVSGDIYSLYALAGSSTTRSAITALPMAIGTDQTADMIGVKSRPEASGVNSSRVIGFEAEINQSAVGKNMTSAIGYHVSNPFLVSGTITNAYGVYVDHLNSGTNNWAIYTDGSTPSYFAGNVGIGATVPSEKLHVVGNLRVQGSTDCTLGNGSGGTSCSSDIRLKDKIREIDNPLSKILSLRGVEFEWNEKSSSPGQKAIGVIAQDVEKVFPTAVVEDPATGFKKVDYAVLVAPIIQALKSLVEKTNEILRLSDTHKRELSRELASVQEENDQLKQNQKIQEQKMRALEERLLRLESALNKK